MKIHGDPGNGYHIEPSEAWRLVLAPVVCFVAAIALSLAWRLTAVNHFGMRPIPPKMAMWALMAAYGLFDLPWKRVGARDEKPLPLKVRLLEVGVRFVPLAGALVGDGMAKAW